MKNINILHIIASSTWGGGEKYVHDLSVKSKENGYDIFLISRKSDVIEQKMKDINAPIKTLPLKNCFDLYSIIYLSYFIRKNKIDLVHVHQFKDAFMVLFASLLVSRTIKIVLTRHLVQKAKTNILYRFLYRKICAFIFVSYLSRDTFLSSNPIISKNIIEVIHNSINPFPLESMHCINLRDKYQIASETKVLTFTGRLVPDKGLDVLLKALVINKNLDVILFVFGVGNDEYMDELKKYVRNEGLDHKVHFMGFVDDLVPYIKQTDIGVFPSICQESFGLMLLDFMKEGVAVITTNNGAQKEFIENQKEGILIRPNNIDDLWVAISELVKNHEMRFQMGCQAKARFERELSYDIFFEKISQIYLS